VPRAYYMDVHVPAAITAGIRRRGVEVLTSQEDATRRAADEELLGRATELGRILVSQDEDLLGIARKWQQTQRSFAGLIFAHQQGASIGQCVEELELIARYMSAEETASQVIYLPLQ
jgi:hypothetical protein